MTRPFGAPTNDKVDNTEMITDSDFLAVVGRVFRGSQSCPLCGAPAPDRNLCRECETLREALIEWRRRASAPWGSAAG